MSRSGVTSMTIFAVILLVILSTSYLLEPTDDTDNDPDFVGTWHLVANESLDQSQRYNRDIDPKFNIIVKEEFGRVFTAESQGLEFCGVRSEKDVMFEYRYGDDAWIRANGSIIKGMLILYETHYYNEDHWFVSISTYSKNDSKHNTSLSKSPDVQMKWNLRSGESHYFDGDAKGYELDGKRFFISGMWGDLFRAEMQQQVTEDVLVDGVLTPVTTVTTRLMNGVFVSDHNGVYIAFMLDSSGKMWTLSIQDDLAVLRAVLISDNISAMVVTQRTYFDGIPPAVPDAPDMEGTWISNGSTSRYGDGTVSEEPGVIDITYEWQEGYLFTGTITFPDDPTPLPAAGYAVYDPTAQNGWLIRLGTDQTGIGGEFKEGYGFLSEDGRSMTAVGFIYDKATGMNGVVFYEFVKS